MNPVIIAIAGGTGSGKSYLTEKLVNTYPKNKILRIEQDSYYRDISNMDYNTRCEQNFDHPEAIDIDLIEDHLKKLICGNTIKIPEYDFNKHLRKNIKRKTKQHPIIIIEGILMLHYVRLHKFYSIKVFIETPEHIRFDRRIYRDIKFRGRTKNSIEKQYYTFVKPMHDKFVQPSKCYADIVIKGTDSIKNSIKHIKTTINTFLT